MELVLGLGLNFNIVKSTKMKKKTKVNQSLFPPILCWDIYAVWYYKQLEGRPGKPKKTQNDLKNENRSSH